MHILAVPQPPTRTRHIIPSQRIFIYLFLIFRQLRLTNVLSYVILVRDRTWNCMHPVILLLSLSFTVNTKENFWTCVCHLHILQMIQNWKEHLIDQMVIQSLRGTSTICRNEQTEILLILTEVKYQVLLVGRSISMHHARDQQAGKQLCRKESEKNLSWRMPSWPWASNMPSQQKW